MDAAAANPLGGNRAALTGAAGSFLAPGLGASASNFTAAFGAVRAQAGIGHLAQVSLVHQIHVYFCRENFIGQFNRAGFFSL